MSWSAPAKRTLQVGNWGGILKCTLEVDSCNGPLKWSLGVGSWSGLLKRTLAIHFVFHCLPWSVCLSLCLLVWLSACVNIMLKSWPSGLGGWNRKRWRDIFQWWRVIVVDYRWHVCPLLCLFVVMCVYVCCLFICEGCLQCRLWQVAFLYVWHVCIDIDWFRLLVGG